MQSSRDKGLVCSLACSALLATTENAKARRAGPGVKGLCSCGNPKKTTAHQCAACLAIARDALLDRTLGDLRAQYSTLEFHAKVRGLARTMYQGPKFCAACGYSLHVDICHVKPVAAFDLSATLREVNAPDNLVALDKRCHWEFDHGYLARLDGEWVASQP
jgi:hypothetical protein